jgi:hypothetical protein
MWVFDGDEWIEEGGTSNNEAPGLVDYRRYQELGPQLQIQEIVPARAGLRNPVPWVPARRIKP